MNHSYIADPNKNICRTCKRTEFEHTDMVACEACNNIGSVEISESMLLCMDCYQKELQVPQAHASITESIYESTTVDTAIINKDYALADLPINGNEFFNNKMLSIKELETKIWADDAIEKKHFFLTEQLSLRYSALKKALFEVKELELEVRSEQAAIQVSLNTLAARLKAEEREKLKLAHPEFVPTVAPTKVSKVKVSKADAQAETYAKLMGITVEHAKRLLAQSLKEAQQMSGLTCTCAETPGICKMHKKE